MTKKSSRIAALILLASFAFIHCVLADVVSGTLGTGSLNTGIDISSPNCNPLNVSNGTVAVYPDCSITCNSGYTLSGSSCIVTPTVSYSSGGGGGGGGGGSYYNPYTITINGGATSTVSANVTLALTAAAGMNRMWISNDSSFASSTGTGWIPFQATYQWTLATASGNTTVYAEFGNASTTTPAGNAVASITVVGNGTGGTSGTTGGGTSYAEQIKLLNLLIAELQALLRQAQAQGLTLPEGAAAYLNLGSGTSTSTPSAITRNLTMGSIGADVIILQEFLIAQNKGPAAQALANHGATGLFASLTKAALAEYQAAVGIKPATGYFGPITRAYLKSIGY